MSFPLRPNPFQLSLAILWLALFGCNATKVNPDNTPTIHLETTAKSSSGKPSNDAYPIALSVTTYSDSRPTAPSRKIGDIRATVVDMHGTELFADQDISSLVTEAISSELSASGFRIASTADKPAVSHPEHFQLTGSVRDFALNIAGRDEVSIAVETTLRDSRGGSVVWSGIVSEKTDRYAGVTGNTKGSIVRYLNGALRTVAGKTAAQVSDAVRQVRPELFNQVTPKPSPGVEVMVSPPVNSPARSKDTPDAAVGSLVIATNPARAKVYVGDIYYGLSPLKLQLQPNVYLLRVMVEGFKTATEKVSVRRGETTELNVTLEK